MIEYALKNDPLPMHIDEQAARTSLYSWFVQAMRMLTAADFERLVGRG